MSVSGMLGHRDFNQFLLCVLCLVASSTAKTLYKSPEGTPPTPQTHYEHVIPVHGNSSVTDCSESGSQMTNLNEPLSEAFRYNKSVQLLLSEGCFVVTSNDLATFSGWTDFAIVGKGMDVSTITCGDEIGFTFLLSTRIVFRNVAITGCSRAQSSTSKNFTADNQTSEHLSFIQFWVGVYFLSCSDITMDHVEISDTNGVGVVMYICNGTNTFNYSTFKQCYREGDKLSRSGNVAIEFSYCLPGDVDCSDSELPSFQTTNSSYTFYQCQFGFSGDPGLDQYNVPIVPYPHGTEHIAFGKGGGLSVIFKGRSSGNSITIDTCTFTYNSAQWGGGLYISFSDQSVDNTVTVVQSQFDLNTNPCDGYSHEWHQAGGAVRIIYFYFPADDELWPGYQPNVLRNSVSFYKTDFISNMACWGGAVSIVVSRETPGQSVTNSVLFDSCRFYYNQASIGAAVDVSIFQPFLIPSNGVLMAPVFKNCQFIQNGLNFSDEIAFEPPTGVVFANLVPLNFSGSNNFTGNDGTALVISGTSIALSESSSILFHSNTGRNGGALAFTGNSWLVVHENTSMTFQNNVAELLGGAISSVHFGEQDRINKYDCFFRYYKATLHQSEWNTTFKFSGNVARNESNSIYVTSLSPCVWPGTRLKLAFCGHPWMFGNNNGSQCTSDVWTGPSNILGQSVLQLVPGWRTWFNATLLNDLGQKIPSVFTVAAYKNQPGIEVNKSTEYIADNYIAVHGKPNRNVANNMLVLRTLDPNVISSFLMVDIKDCPFGYKQQNCTIPGSEHMVCDCICADHIHGIGCNAISHHIKVFYGYCLTYSYNGTDWSKPAVVGSCPHVPNDIEIHYNVSYDPVDLDRKVCRKLQRTGLLCSKCIEGYAVDVNSYEFPCVKCQAQYSWFLYILAELVPIVIFFIIVVFLNVRMTAAPMNTFIFFSQIVTVPYFHTPYAFMFGYLVFPYYKVLEALVAFPYAIWNLNFFATAAIPGFCLHESVGTLEILALKYLNAFLPLLLIFVCYILIKLYDHNYRAVRFIWRPFQKCLKKIYKNRESKTSVIDVFATFLLLSYSKVLFVSFSLFAFTSIRDASTNEVIKSPVFYFDASVPVFHGKYAILSISALIIFALFVTLPPLFLTFYPLRCTQIVINKLPFKITLRTFAEAFNGDFRDGTSKDGPKGDNDCRWFAGYYFLLRVIVFSIYVSELKWLEQYFIQQVVLALCIILFANIRPYKDNYYNKLDTAMFSLLAVLNAFSFYNSQHHRTYNHINDVAFWINYLLIFLPLIYIICNILYLILQWKGCLKESNKSMPLASSSLIEDPSSIGGEEMSENHISRGSRDEDVPDRLVNPQNYNSRNLYRPFDPQSVSRKKQQRPRQGSSEKSYFYGKKDRKMISYGSLSAVPTERHSEPVLPKDKKANDNTHKDSSGGKHTGIHFKGDV